MALPTIDAISAAWPSAQIDVFVGRHSAVAFAFRPHVTIRSVPDRLDLPSAMALSRELRAAGYDAVINLDRSRWLRAATTTSRSHTQASVLPMKPEVRHEADVYLDVVRQLGLQTPVMEPSVVPTAAGVDQAAVIVNRFEQPFAILHPGGARNPGSTMHSKRWPADRFVRVAQALEARNVKVLLSGGPDEVNVAATVADGARLSRDRVLAGRVDIEALAAMIAKAAIYIGPDTGMSHIAAALGTPTVAIFGPTNPRRYRPLGPRVRIVAPGSSWFLPDRDLRNESGTHQTVCTAQVTVDEVLAVIGSLLDRNGQC